MLPIRIFGHYLRPPLLILAALELLLFAKSYVLALHVRAWLADIPLSGETLGIAFNAVLLALVFSVWMGAMGLYEASLREGFTGSAIRIVAALTLGTVVLASISFALPWLDFWRSVLLLSAAFALVGVILLRLAFYAFDPRIFRRRVLVLGSSQRADELAAITAKTLDIVGLVPLGGARDHNVGPIPWIAHDRPLRRVAVDFNVDEIVLALSDRRGHLPIEELLDCKMSGIDVLELQSFFEREVGIVKLDMLTPSWLVHSDGFRQGALSRASKRLFDLVAAAALGVLFAPVMLCAALAILAESGWRHPVLYRQTRVGEHGRPFQVIKFRSMRVDAEADGRPRWATRGDDRITRVGRFIRTTRIDEMPQIFNILRGEMSFVGPRPERPEFVVLLARKHPFYASRHYLKPGLTGWAQLRYPYGNTEEDALRKLEYDLYYVKNYSLFLDMLILVGTVEVVLFGKGAM